MRPLGILLATLCALTATATAGPSEPARPALEVEGASALAREGTDLVDAAGPSGVPRELDPEFKVASREPVVDSSTERPACNPRPAVVFSLAPSSFRRRPNRRPAAKAGGPCASCPGAAVAYASWDNRQPEGKRCDPSGLHRRIDITPTGWARE